MARYLADEVADAVICLARARQIDITNLKLQKLLYYCQAWSLVFTGQALFAERIEAWVHGPVVPSIFRRFREFRWNTIDCVVTPPTSATLTAHLNAVLDSYGNIPASQLERLTHSEAPWQIARKGLPPDVSSNEVITLETMKAFYAQLANAAAR
jgi:uncharacterized phage-associated protein